MKKGLTTLLVILLAVGAMFVSCKAEVGTPADELVSASFELDSSRALSATLEPFNPDAYYWKYAAKKNVADTSGLTSGATDTYDEAGAEWVHTGTLGPAAGLAGYIVPNFSQGLWDFTLYAYKDAEGNDLVYQGEATAATLVKGGKNMVHVVVSPAPTGTGTLYIGTTSLTPRESTDVPTVSRFLKVEDLDGHEYAPTSGTTYELAAGAYKVTVTFKTSGIVYAEGTVIATVYPNMTTTVTGSVDELVTYAQFEAEQNPDIIARTAGVDGIHKNDDVSDYYTLVEKDTPAADVKVTATVPAAAAKNLLPKDSEEQIIADASMSLLLNVDTKDSTSTSVTYEISMTKVVTLDSEVTTSDVTDLGMDDDQNLYYATAMVQLSKGLTGVKVQHDEHDMKESTSTADDQGYGIYSYDADSGILTIKTNTFSPFKVSYDGNTAGVAEVGGTKYATVAEAFAAAKSGQTIKLLENADGAGLFLAAGSKIITLDLNGKTYTITKDAVGSPNTENQGLHLESGNTVTIKNGKITSVAGSGVSKILIQNYSNLTLQDVELDGSNIGAGKYTLSNNYGTVSITGSTSIKAPENGYAFDAYFWPKLSYDQVGVTVNTTGTIDGTVQVWSDDDYETYGNSITIQNGTFTGSIDFRKGNLSIVGGTFSADPRPYLADGYEAILSDGVWTVSSIPSGQVARIGSTYYDSLQAAIDAAQSGDAVYLLRDVTNNKIFIDKSITLDGSYKTITESTCNKALAITGETVSVKNIELINKYSAGRCVDTRGNVKTLDLDHVTMECNGSGYIQPITISFNTDDGIPSWITEVNISNSEIKYNRSSYSIIVFVPSDITISDSTISGWSAIYLKNSSGNSNVTIDNSTLTSVGLSGSSNSFGLINLENGAYHDTITITDSDIRISTSSTDSVQALVSFSSWYGPNTGTSVSITGGSISLDGDNATFVIENGAENSLTISDSAIDVNDVASASYSYESPEVLYPVAYMYPSGESILCDGFHALNVLLAENTANSSHYFCDYEFLILYEDSEITADAKFDMQAGNTEFGIVCGNFSLAKSEGVTVSIPAGVTVKVDKQLSDFFSAPAGYEIAEAEITDDTYTYSYTSVPEVD